MQVVGAVAVGCSGGWVLDESLGIFLPRADEEAEGGKGTQCPEAELDAAAVAFFSTPEALAWP